MPNTSLFTTAHAMVARLVAAVAIIMCCTMPTRAIEVTLTFDEGQPRPAALDAAERNLAAVLTEINRAQSTGTSLNMGNFAMEDFAKKSLARIWAVTPFYCDDYEVVERCWVFSNGQMTVSHIPLIIMPEGDEYGRGTYQEAVAEFDRNGRITDFRFALSSQMSESMERCGEVATIEQQMIILRHVERFRTAYNQQDINTISNYFSDDAVIITGNVVAVKALSDSDKQRFKVSYTRQNKQQYINNLRRAFARNKWINVTFTQLGEGADDGSCPGITRSKVNPHCYGVRLHQSWRSSNYSDDGYLFLLFRFPDEGGDPEITVRTWQPEYVSGQQQAPDPEISTLGGFDL